VGALTCKKQIRVLKRADRDLLPVSYLVDSAGGRLTDQLGFSPGRRGAARIFHVPDAVSIRAEARSAIAAPTGCGAVSAPMQGTVVKVAVEEGQEVASRDVIAVVEAMKMKNAVTAPRAGTVSGLQVAVGDATAQGAVLCELA